jgi:hypothetical protein
MISSWDTTKPRSRYHFDSTKMDPDYDTVIHLGRFVANWDTELEEVIATAQPATWRTRGQVGNSRPEEELAAEEYDLEREGYGKDYVITHLNWNIAPVFQKISDLFAMEDTMTRIHVQQPGEVWNLHLDKLEKWNPNNPDSVLRAQIQLTSWQPGHFWSYGNYIHSGWPAGDVTTFDWQNVPHSTANAGHTARVTLQVTGVRTEQTEKFLQRLRQEAVVIE